jgi:hypothetical protein
MSMWTVRKKDKKTYIYVYIIDVIYSELGRGACRFWALEVRDDSGSQAVVF